MSLHAIRCEHGGHPYLCDLCSPEMPAPGYDARTRPLRRPSMAYRPSWRDALVGWVEDSRALLVIGLLVLLLAAVWFGGSVAIR